MKKVIQIAYNGHKRDVVADVYGAFGVHRAPMTNHYTVTHIPTGYAAHWYAANVQSGLRLARMLTRCGVDWWSVTKPTRLPKRTKELAKAVIARWKG